MIKTKGGCTCTCTYSLFLCQLFVGRKTSREKGDAGNADPSLGRGPAGRSGALGPTYSSLPGCPAAPCSPVPASPCPPWDPPGLSCHGHSQESPVCPGTGTATGTGTGTVLLNPPAAPGAQGRWLLSTPVLGGRGAAVLTKLLMTATGSYYKHLSLI